MRVAVLYAGDIRTWNKCRENQLRNIPGEKDLYFYTYTEPENTIYKKFIQASLWNGVWDDRYAANKHPWIDTSRVMKIWENLYNGFQMIPREDDVYVKSRCDIELNGEIEFNKFTYPPNKVYIPKGSDYENGVNDQFAFGSYEAMEKYFSVHSNHPKMFEDGLRRSEERRVGKECRSRWS